MGSGCPCYDGSGRRESNLWKLAAKLEREEREPAPAAARDAKQQAIRGTPFAVLGEPDRCYLVDPPAPR